MNVNAFEAMGIAAMIPGLQHSVELLQKQLDELKARLRAAQTGERIPGRRGRPPNVVQASLGGAAPKPKERRGSSWAGMTKEERSIEMRRRMAKAHLDLVGEKAAKPIAAKKSDYAARASGYWAKMTPEQRSKEMQRRSKVALGRAKSQAKQPWRRKQVGARGPMHKAPVTTKKVSKVKRAAPPPKVNGSVESTATA